MTFENYETVLRPKVSGVWNLHNALANSELDFFIMLSSVAGIVGNKGQAAYAAANTYLDAFAHYRRRKGLTAVSLNLTAVEGVGYLAENIGKRSEVLKNLSGNVMSESEVLALVETAIAGKVAIATGACSDQCITGLDFDDPFSLPYYSSDGKFSHLRDTELSRSANGGIASASAELPIAHRLQQTSTVEEAQEVLTIGLRDKLSAILMLPVEVVEPQKSITASGLDSLNAIELRNWVSKELQAHSQVLELLTGGGLRDLAALVLRKTRLKGVWSQQDQV
jgi:hypothetical protein